MTSDRRLALGAGLLWGCMASLPASPPSDFRFVEVAAEAGLDRVLLAGRPGKDHLLDSAGAGAAWIDYDRDGHLDLYLVNGWRLEGGRVVEKGNNALYRNRGDGIVEDVTERAGVADAEHWGSGVAVADFDGDGWPDLFVTNFGPNVLYRNRGDGTFQDVAAEMGLQAPGWNTGAAFLDADRDGDLDLYVARYIEASLKDVLEARPTLDWKGVVKVALGPFGLPGATDRFFSRDGERFVEATEPSGLTDRARGFGFAVQAHDFDDDGDLDLYVANDSDANFLYRNEGGGKFQEIGLWSGAALDANGAAQAGMGLAVGDVDGDGLLDVFVTNFSEDFSTLYRALGDAFFEDASRPSGVGPASYQPLSWGAVLEDFDSDGDLDLAIANGHIYPQVEEHPDLGIRYRQPNLLLENDGRGNFTDVTGRAGPGFQQAESSRALVAGDYDDDGDVDLLVTHLDAPPSLLRNDGEQGNWLRVECRLPSGSPWAVGARVTVTAGGRRTVREIASNGSFLSAHDPRLHFGLGTASQADRVEVRWPDGTVTRLDNVPANQRLLVVQATEQTQPGARTERR